MKKIFKIGQRVKVIEACWTGFQKIGEIGKITEINNAGEYHVEFADGSGGLVKKVEAVKRGRKPEGAYVYTTEKLYLSKGAYSGKKKILKIEVNGKEVPFKQINEDGRFEFL